MKNLFSITLLIILASCGGSKVSSSDGAGSGETNPGGSTGTTNQVNWTSAEGLELGLQKMSMNLTSANSRIYFMDEEYTEYSQRFSAGSDSNSLDFTISEVGDSDSTENGSLTKDEIIAVILNSNDTYGVSRIIEVTPLQGGVETFRHSQGYGQLQAYLVSHTLEDGNQVQHVIVPSLPLYANPVATSVSSTDTLFDLFDIQRVGVPKRITQVGDTFIRVN